MRIIIMYYMPCLGDKNFVENFARKKDASLRGTGFDGRIL